MNGWLMLSNAYLHLRCHDLFEARASSGHTDSDTRATRVSLTSFIFCWRKNELLLKYWGLIHTMLELNLFFSSLIVHFLNNFHVLTQFLTIQFKIYFESMHFIKSSKLSGTWKLFGYNSNNRKCTCKLYNLLIDRDFSLIRVCEGMWLNLRS